jgi:hypothetical protein
MKIERIDFNDRQDWMLCMSRHEALRLIELLARRAQQNDTRSIELDHGRGKLLIQLTGEPDPPNISDLAAEMKAIRERLEKDPPAE